MSGIKAVENTFEWSLSSNCKCDHFVVVFHSLQSMKHRLVKGRKNSFNPFVEFHFNIGEYIELRWHSSNPQYLHHTSTQSTKKDRRH
jgi:hypothetical protein